MIERAITEKDTNSRFYRHNEGLAKSWEDFTALHDGRIEGMVNGFILKADINLNYQGKEIKINLIRQLSNKTAEHSTGLLMTKNTRIEIEPITIKEGNWSLISHNTFLKLFYSLIKYCEPLSLDNHYMIVSNQKVNQSGMFDLQYWKNLNSIAEIRRINYIGGNLRIEFLNFLGPDSAERAINEVMKKYID